MTAIQKINTNTIEPVYAGLTKNDPVPKIISAEQQHMPSYDTKSFGSWYPILSEQISAKDAMYPQYLDNGYFIGSLALKAPPQNEEQYKEIEKALTSGQDECVSWTLSIPSFCNIDNLNELLNKVKTLTESSSSETKWKEVKNLEDVADKIKEIDPTTYAYVEFILLEAYKNLPQVVRDQFSPKFKQLLLDFQFSPTYKEISTNYLVRLTPNKETVINVNVESKQSVPNKEPDYDDLSAYLNAPFPKLNLDITEENPELKDILDKLDNLSLEDLNIPLVQVQNCDLTERVIDGTGVFDVMMTATFNQLLKTRKDNLITQAEIAEIYKAGLVQNIQVASSFTLEKANILNQSYSNRINAIQAAANILNTKAQLLMLPVQIRTAYAQLEVQLKQLDLLKVQIEIEKEKYPQVIAQTDLILAQTDGQRLSNEQAQVAIQQGKLQHEQTRVAIQHAELQRDHEVIAMQTDKLNQEALQVQIQQNKLVIEQTKEQIALMEEQNRQARLQTYGQELANKQTELQLQTNEQLFPEQIKQLQVNTSLVQEQHKQLEIQNQVTEATSEYTVNQAKLSVEVLDEQRKTQMLQANKLVQDTKLVEKQVMLADVQKHQAEAQVRVMGIQLEKEKESLGLVKAQIASAFAQLALYKDQLLASKAQYSDTINGKPIGGLLGAQILANKVQASSLERKAYMEIVQNLQSGWAANKTADIAITSPTAFTPLVVDRAVQWGMEKYFNMPKDIMNTPEGYTPYLKDEEMDSEDSIRSIASNTGKKAKLRS